MEVLAKRIEAWLVTSSEPVALLRLAEVCKVTVPEVVEALEEIKAGLEGHGFTLVLAQDEVRLAVAPDVAAWAAEAKKFENAEGLSRALAETLALVMYRGPVSLVEMSEIRGVDSRHALKSLLDRDLIAMREDQDGKRYVVTALCLQNMGVERVQDLPDYAECMSIIEVGLLVASFLALPFSGGVGPEVAGAQTNEPIKTGESLGVVVTAESVLAWDVKSGKVLFEKDPDEEREIASITKLLSALVVREELALDHEVLISSEARKAQRWGAHVGLPLEQHVTVRELLAASMIASANDAMLALALEVAEDEDKFAELATQYAQEWGMENTKTANATGLTYGEQYSTARDVRTMLMMTYEDEYLGALLDEPDGVLYTKEGGARKYKTTNKLLRTYLPINAAKTGYTPKARENVALITESDDGHEVGIVVLGSEQRFQDAKVVAEWVWRNYSWGVQ